MKTKIYSIVLIMISMSILLNKAAAQRIAYYDAKSLAEKFHKMEPSGNKIHADSAEILTILTYYFGEGTDIELDIRSNPFLSPYFNNNANASGNIIELLQQQGFGGATNVTSLADGLAKFLVKRAKEELYASFFEKFETYLQQHPEIAMLFPDTKVLLENFKSWEYANIIITLREAFDKDLKALLSNICNIKNASCNDRGLSDKDLKACNERLQKLNSFFNSESGIIFSSGLQIANGFIYHNSVPDVINTISGNDYLGNPVVNTDLRNASKLLAILSNSVRSKDAGEDYISAQTFKDELIGDKVTRDIYFGLLYQQFKKEKIKIGSVDLSADIQPLIDGLQFYISNVLKQAEELTAAYKTLKQMRLEGTADLASTLDVVINTSQKFLQSALNIQQINIKIRFPQQFVDALSKNQTLLSIGHDILVKNYNAAIVGLLTYLNQTLANDPNVAEFKQQFVKYGSFAANVVSSTNSDDVEKAIESVALPVGSASIKKHSAFNISLNAYPGPFYGQQKLASDNKYKSVTGLFAPVGIAFSTGIGNGNHPWSLSLFGSIIDVGALAAFRLTNPTDTIASNVNVKLSQIVAPGVHFVIGLPGVPISIGAGKHWMPLLSKVEKDAVTLNEATGSRWQIFAAVDIPLLNFYNKSKLNTTIKKQ